MTMSEINTVATIQVEKRLLDEKNYKRPIFMSTTHQKQLAFKVGLVAALIKEVTLSKFSDETQVWNEIANFMSIAHVDILKNT